MRSRNEIRWGEVYSPTPQPASLRAAAISVETLPFPFVPPTWTDGIISCGLPTAFSRARVLLSPNLMVVVRGNRKSRASSYVSDIAVSGIVVCQAKAKHENTKERGAETKRPTQACRGWGA